MLRDNNNGIQNPNYKKDGIRKIQQEITLKNESLAVEVVVVVEEVTDGLSPAAAIVLLLVVSGVTDRMC